MSALGSGRASDPERLRRWRLVLGGEAADELGEVSAPLDADGRRIDAALGAIYDRRPVQAGRGTGRSGRAGGLGRSAPAVARWLGDIRTYFPSPVVQVLQRDAIDRFELRQLLLEPELLREIVPDVHLATLLVELHHLLPETTRATARQVVARVVDELTARLAAHTRQAVHGALARTERSRHPRPADIDWDRTIRANLRHWLPDQRTLVPEHLVGFGRRRRSLAREVVIALDQSGSMADSIVHAAVAGAVLASLPSLSTRLVVFDTEVADLTALLADPVEVLFGVQLGGGTDIAGALAFCQQLIGRPAETVVVLVSDLFEGGSAELLHRRAAELVRAGVTVVALLALSDDGAPFYDHGNATALADLGIAVFACTPAHFPDLMAAALERRDLSRWAAEHDLTVAAASATARSTMASPAADRP